MKTRLLRYLGLAIGVFGTACGVHQAATPTLSGPSTLATNITISATPDSLTQNGFSQAAVKVSVFGPNGQPVSGQPLRLYMAVGGTVVDYGALNTKSIVTGNDGTATAVYTAPLPAPPPNDSTMTAVSIVATLVSSDAQTTQPVQTAITLVPAGVILPPASAPVAAFSVTTGTPVTNTPTLFDATASCGGPLTNGACSGGDSIATYAWSFGDGGTGTGATPSHTFLVPNAYNVTLMVTTSRGAMSAPTTKSIAVGQSASPTAAFVFSPSQPSVGTSVVFNATQATAAPGHNIVSYTWIFGDGATGTGSLATHTFTSAGTYNVTLTTTDDAGQKGTSSTGVAVANASSGGGGGATAASFITSPSSPVVGQSVFFNASASTAATGKTISGYQWNFGDGTTLSVGTSSTTHTFSTPGTFTVSLTVTDSGGTTATTTNNVIVTSLGAAAPTARFTSSPSQPALNQTVFFNASTSTAGSGHTIQTYAWDFGDGSTATGQTAQHAHPRAGIYTVTLTVTDEASQTGIDDQYGDGHGSNSSQIVAAFTFSPTNPSVGQTIFFDSTPSSPTATQFAWDFGDGTVCGSAPLSACPGSNAKPTHSYATANTWIVRLTVTDNNNPPNSATTQNNVTTTP